MQPSRSWPDLIDDKEKEKDEYDDLAASDTATTDTGETEALAPPVEVTMDDYFFKEYVYACRNVVESTSYLEILNYSVSCQKKSLRSSRDSPEPMPRLTGGPLGCVVCV